MTDEERDNPFSHRPILVRDDGTIPTWIVTWEGDGVISARSSGFIHKEDAEAEYTWIMNSLKERMIWHRSKHKLSLTDGERVAWADLFEEPGIYNWEA